eukprot:535241-Hanusia_phi.AAC.5
MKSTIQKSYAGLLSGLEDHESECLRFGDQIVISPEGHNAILMHSGYKKSRPLIQIFYENITTPTNILDCRWRISPKCQYEASKALKKIQKKRLWDGGQGLPVPRRPGRFETVEEAASKFAAAHNLHDVEAVKEVMGCVVAMEEEQEANEAELIRRQGKIILFGDSIQIRHVTSGLFLTISKLRGSEKGTRAFEMTDQGNDYATFKVQPAFRTYGQGEPIRSGDLAFLASEKKIFGLHMLFHMSSTVGRDTILRDKLLDENQLTLSSAARTGLEELNASPVDATTTMFRLVIFQQWEEPQLEDEYVHGDDVVCLYHKDFESYLEFNGNDGDIGGPVWRESQRTSEKARKKSYWMWRIEFSSLVSGGERVNAMARHFRLKHLLTDLYLCVKHGNTLGVTDDINDENALFSFKLFSKDESVQPVRSGSSVFLVSKCHGWVVAKQHTVKDDELKKRYCRKIGIRPLDYIPERDVVMIVRVNSKMIANVVKVKDVFQCCEGESVAGIKDGCRLEESSRPSQSPAKCSRGAGNVSAFCSPVSVTK